ncbi:hypothetical protein BSKO_03332 [Bryopsis sp. KO-2023]|nr:hypothetical protein BSKO_03332 [Bryopsis sp. KO-2023]
MHEYEFLGPTIGPVGIIFGLPVVCYLLGVASGQKHLSAVLPLLSEALRSGELFSFQSLAVVLGWFAAVALLHLALPGQHAVGVVLSDKSQLKYKLNGFTILATIYTLCLGGAFATPYLKLGWLYLHWLQILTASMLLSFALSFYLFATSFRKKALLADGGQTPSNLYNFFIGRELNPRIGRFDLKEFCELYPGLIGWVVLNLGMAHQQWLDLGRVTNSMVLVNVFHLVYVADALWHEKSILTTMDITTDGFGFMLAFGDLTWVPFIYAIQAKFLVDQPVDLDPIHATLVSLLNIVGYAIFRGANSQKDQFRRDPRHPSVSHLKTMKTERGRELIISGWWGMARHINYTGDWLMSLAWCLTTGFVSLVPYFHAVYFAILLIHRDLRDGLSCRLKYGKDWDKYCGKVRYRFIPWVY